MRRPIASIPFKHRATRLQRHRAFTLIEMMLGMVVTMLVMGAITALMTSVAHGWKQSEADDGSSAATAMTHLRLQKIFKGAKQIGAVRGGGLDGTASPTAAVIFWRADANSDGLIQFSELGMVEHEMGASAALSKLVYYHVVFPSTMTPAAKLAADGAALASNDIYDDAEIDAFKSMTYVVATPLAGSIVGAEFNRIDGANIVRPKLEYMLNFQRGGATETEYGTVSVRTPTTLPASQGT